MSIIARPFRRAGAATGYVPAGAIWLDGSADELHWTPSGAGTHARKWTVSFWMKRAEIGAAGVIFNADSSSSDYISIGSGDTLTVGFGTGGSLVTDQVFRDPSAWYHIVVAVDRTQATASDKVNIYINGNKVNDFGTETYPSDADGNVNSAVIHYWGEDGSGTHPALYLAECIHVDGQQLDQTAFGEFDALGQWVPVNPSGETFGTNGSWLDFANSADLGNDVSGNTNDWTPNSITSTNASMDNPMDDADNGIGNYPKFTELDANSNITVSNGGLTVGNTGASDFHGAVVPFRIPNTGLWYFEVQLPATLSNQYIGVVDEPNKWDFVTAVEGAINAGFYGFYPVNSTSSKLDNGSSSSYGGSIANSSILGFAIDMDAREMFVSDDDAWLASSDPVTNTSPMLSTLPDNLYVAAVAILSGSSTLTFNFGETDFAGTIPAGYKPLNTANLPAPSVTDPSAYFQTVLYTGSAGSQSITGAGFQPDLVWGKRRDGIKNHLLFDAVRGATSWVSPNLSDTENTVADTLTSFDSDGFSLGADGSGHGINIASQTYVAWCLKAGGSGSSNTDGSITSTVSVADHGGFSIAKYTGTGANATFGHGLSSAPDFVILKSLDGSQDWYVWHPDLGATTNFILLNSTAAKGTSSPEVWNSTAPTSTVVHLGSSIGVNTNTDDHIAYCFAKTSGFIGIGSYVGNGSADGPYVVVDDGGAGFRPAAIMRKRINSTGPWFIHDSARDPYNIANHKLDASDSAVETTSAFSRVDLLANGFKVRDNNADMNASGGTYIYLAFAEYPFGGEGVAQGRGR